MEIPDSVGAVLVLRTQFSFVVAMTDASVMILLWKACCTWKVGTALMTSVPKVQYQFSFWRWKSFIYPLLIETWSSLQLISNILFHREAILYHPQTALSSSSTQIAICCPHFRYIQYNINALYCFFRRCGPLLEMLLYQRLVSFHFLFIQNSPYQLGSSRLANIRIFNLCICSIYCCGVFPSPSSLDTFIGSEVSAALSLMDCLSSTEFKAESETGMLWVCWLARSCPQFLLSFHILVVSAGLTDLFLLYMHLHALLSCVVVSGYRDSPWAYLPKLVTGWRSEVSTLVTCTI